jgi:hypothetical protein
MIEDKDTSPGNETPDMTPRDDSASTQLPTEGDPDKADAQPLGPQTQSSDAPVTG